jgi:dihydrofolate synthase/folylpolyglutamate synthase
MTFQETLDFLYTQLPVFHLQGASAYKKDLSRTQALLAYLGNPHLAFNTIHIAGTNGKGSCSHYMASVLQEAHYKTGLYTSPHVVHFGERIKINGRYVEEDFVIRFVERIKHLFPEIKPSFFEVTVAMAFQYFAEKKVDIAVIETGVGGKLDSTNVITPILSLITNISYDHMDLLGNTLPEIASQKAGIIKKQVPVVIGERQKEVESVFVQTAQNQNADLFFASDCYQIHKNNYINGSMLCRVKQSDGHDFEIKSGLLGDYQLKNLAGILQSVDVVRQKGIKISDEALHLGIEKVIVNTGLRGRWQILSENPLTVCDIAHNEEGIRSVLETATGYKSSHLHIVLGVVKDKDLTKILRFMPKEASYYFSQAHIPRALPVIELQQKAIEFGIKGLVFEEVNEAIAHAKGVANANDLILVCGSNFLVAEIR